MVFKSNFGQLIVQGVAELILLNNQLAVWLSEHVAILWNQNGRMRDEGFVIVQVILPDLDRAAAKPHAVLARQPGPVRRSHHPGFRDAIDVLFGLPHGGDPLLKK